MLKEEFYHIRKKYNEGLGAMLDVFPAEIDGTIPIANPGLIYGAMIFRTLFWRLF